MPGLQDLLLKAGINKKPTQFLKDSLISSFILTTFLVGLMVIVSLKIIHIQFLILSIASFVLLMVMIGFFLNAPNMMILKKRKQIDEVIIGLGRQMLIQVRSGIPIYDILRFASKQKNEAGKTFLEITNKVSLGIDLEIAIAEAVEKTPSEKLQRILSQILNSLNTGSQLASSIENLIDQITDEAIVEIQKYGKKLNPIAMFYMMIAVIVPTLGVTMLIVISSFLALQITLVHLILMVVLIGFIQLIFISVIKKGRPNVNI